MVPSPERAQRELGHERPLEPEKSAAVGFKLRAYGPDADLRSLALQDYWSMPILQRSDAVEHEAEPA